MRQSIGVVLAKVPKWRVGLANAAKQMSRACTMANIKNLLADGAKALDLGRRGGGRHAYDGAYCSYSATRSQGNGLGRPQDSS